MADKSSQPPVASGMDPGRLYVWVKGLESKVNALLREMNVIKTDVMKKQSQLRGDARVMNDDLLELKREQERINQKLDLIIKELKQTAGSDELQTIKRYMELWNPLNFVTQRDLERAIDARLTTIPRPLEDNPNKKNK
ncbi:MAG: hypothetical protein AABX37_04365 [Nanoarchaeota archaeon]